ncbi:hypothetical protein BD309DRAFT_991775 [Dichomitus squalens]|nr:hypothetical protein BD309DRAFT_991775 [Dichomitus squalens]
MSTDDRPHPLHSAKYAMHVGRSGDRPPRIARLQRSRVQGAARSPHTVVGCSMTPICSRSSMMALACMIAMLLSAVSMTID